MASDCISRDAALKILNSVVIRYDELKPKHELIIIKSAMEKMADEIVKALVNLPSVEPERKPGIWKHEDAGVWICGVCGEEVGEMGDEYGVPKYNFCPYCGADMTWRCNL